MIDIDKLSLPLCALGADARPRNKLPKNKKPKDEQELESLAKTLLSTPHKPREESKVGKKLAKKDSNLSFVKKKHRRLIEQQKNMRLAIRVSARILVCHALSGAKTR